MAKEEPGKLSRRTKRVERVIRHQAKLQDRQAKARPAPRPGAKQGRGR